MFFSRAAENSSSTPEIDVGVTSTFARSEYERDIYILSHTHDVEREIFSHFISTQLARIYCSKFPFSSLHFCMKYEFQDCVNKKNEIVINSQKKSVWWENEYQLVAHDDDDDRERSRRVWKVAQEMIETFYRAVCCVRDQDEIWSGRDGLKWKCSTRLISLLLLREEYGWNDINFFFLCVSFHPSSMSPFAFIEFYMHRKKNFAFPFQKDYATPLNLEIHAWHEKSQWIFLEKFSNHCLSARLGEKFPTLFELCAIRV